MRPSGPGRTCSRPRPQRIRGMDPGAGELTAELVCFATTLIMTALNFPGSADLLESPICLNQRSETSSAVTGRVVRGSAAPFRDVAQRRRLTRLASLTQNEGEV